MSTFHRKLNDILEGIKLSSDQRLEFDWDNDSDDDIIGFNDISIKPVKSDFGIIFSIFRSKEYDDSHKVVGVGDSNKNARILEELSKCCEKLNDMVWTGSSNMRNTSIIALNEMKTIYARLTALGKNFIPKLDNIVDNAIVKIRDGSVDQDSVMRQINHIFNEISNLKVRNKDDKNRESKLFKKGANSILGAMRGKHKAYYNNRTDSDRESLNKVDDHTDIDKLIEIAVRKLCEYVKTTDLYDVVVIPQSSSNFIGHLADEFSKAFKCSKLVMQKVPTKHNGKPTKVLTYDDGKNTPYFDLKKYQQLAKGDEKNNDNPQMHWQYKGRLSDGIPKNMKAISHENRLLWHHLYKIKNEDIDIIMGNKVLIIDDSYDSGATIKMCMETISYLEPSLLHGCVVFDLSAGK